MNNQVISIIGELHKNLYYENAFLDNVVDSVAVELHQFLKYNPDDINKHVLARVIRRAISKLPKKIEGNAVIKRGGDASDTAEILATLGVSVQLISVIGIDFTEALEELKSIAIDSDLIRIINKKTPISTILKSNFSTKIFVASNLKRNIDFKGLKLTDSQIRKMKLTHFAPISSQFKDIINRLQHYNVIISANLEKQKLNSLEELDNTIEQRIDLLFTSYSDISRILGKNYQVKEIDDILKKYAKIRVITEGKNGSHIFAEELDNMFISPLQVEVVNRTGAGDSYAAGFLMRFCELIENKTKLSEMFIKENNKTLKEVLITCGIYGTGVATFKISKHLYPSRTDIEEFLLSFKRE